MFEIEVCCSPALADLAPDDIRTIVQRTLRAEQVARAEISIALVDNTTIHDLNRRHLNHDYETDVLSFLLDSDRPPHTEIPRGRERSIEGEVIVSVEMAAATGPRFDFTTAQETTLYLVHGLLHLCGYDDLTEDEQPIMRKRERDILALWNLTPHFAEATGRKTGDHA